jgi:hypothetical protein
VPTNRPRARRLAVSAAALLAALALALATVRIQRVGTAPAEWTQELCAPEPLHACTEGVLMGGWPAAFLVDRPGISVMGKLALVEDLFRPGPFILDWGIVWIALELLTILISRTRRAI